ncbi:MULTISPECIES: T9SS type B sorting domain-containing protein [Flavobacteriaceae]|uniref:T9SS type B sorting domain-containing protein n=1 Tax=Flavobacteriaceae TaxID=49546 RepID=UPI001491615F|nr:MULTISPECIES: T9SS type B sorting domain-containing protein [Allomuricauda]MDC6366721.1 T9SS type B sorting domain-containing protein [Muricauda sp. AC10]
MGLKAQLCEGSLGDPVVEIDFGSGTGRGDALGSDVTAFTYVSSGQLGEGEYTIANTTSGLKGNWFTTTDHTGDTNGYMMVINSAVLADEGVFYTQTVTGLCANTTYEFSAWVMNVLDTSTTDQYSPDVTFRISDTSGNVLGSYNTGDIEQSSSPTWIQYGFYFSTADETEVIITMLNFAPSARPGNDIALDDIAFSPCGPIITTTIENETSTSLTICEDESVSYTFESTISSGYTDPRYQWQYSNDNGVTWTDISGETSSSYIFSNDGESGTFLFRVSIASGDNIDTISCRIVSDVFTIEILETPEPLTGEAEQTFCTTQNATVSDIEVTGDALWYDAATDGNELGVDTELVDGETYYGALETTNGCVSDVRIPVLITIVEPTLAFQDVTDIICDDLNDGVEIVDLTQYESEITACADCIYSYYTTQSGAESATEDDGIDEPSNYEWTSLDTQVFVRIESSDNCSQIAQVAINLQASPIIEIDENAVICEDEVLILDAGPDFDSYLWSTSETTSSVILYEPGSYWVTVTQETNGLLCNTTQDIEVSLANAPIITSIDIEDWTESENVIEVYLSNASVGDYEYSIDGINYQDSNIFTDLERGEYTVYVREKSGCGYTNQMVYILNYQKFFTPNSDGKNDEWLIQFSETEPDLLISIYDRYGKLLVQMDSSASWDGTFMGRRMPSSDYWFVVTRQNGRIHKGHFSLIR